MGYVYIYGVKRPIRGIKAHNNTHRFIFSARACVYRHGEGLIFISISTVGEGERTLTSIICIIVYYTFISIAQVFGIRANFVINYVCFILHNYICVLLSMCKEGIFLFLFARYFIITLF